MASRAGYGKFAGDRRLTTDQGELDDAIQHLREAEGLIPDSADIRNTLGITL